MPKELRAPLSKSDFEAIAAHCYEVASPIILNGGSVDPVIVAGVVRDGTVTVHWQREVAELAKEIVLPAMERLVENPETDFAVHICEAWVRTIKRGDVIPEGSIAEDSQRREVVLFNIMSKDSQHLVHNQIHREPVWLERGAIDFSLQLNGQMVRELATRN